MLFSISRGALRRRAECWATHLAREDGFDLLRVPLGVYLPNTEARRRDLPFRRASGGNKTVCTGLKFLHGFDRLLRILANRFLDGASEQPTRRQDLRLVFAGMFGVRFSGEQRPHFVPILETLQVVLQLVRESVTLRSVEKCHGRPLGELPRHELCTE